MTTTKTNETTNKPTSTSTSNYKLILDTLLSQPHVFHSPPTSPHALVLHKTSSTLPTIASLSLHPVLESILHLLNADLPSAHFLLRHMQLDRPEAMYTHGLLHRIEGDVDNARAWYTKVSGFPSGKSVVDEMWSDTSGWESALDRFESWSKRKRVIGAEAGAEEEGLSRLSMAEFSRLLSRCERLFGTGEMTDASAEYTTLMGSGDEKHAQLAREMVTGGEGWREF